MNQRLIAILSVSLLILVAVGAVIYVRLHPSAQLSNASQAPVVAKARAGDVAPQFAVATTTGLFDLSKTTKPVFLEVFATWCPHCQRETTVIDKLFRQFNGKVAFIAIPGSDTGMDGTSPSSQLDVLNFQQRFHVSYPIAAYDPSLTAANLYLAGGFPTMAVIAKNKTISYITSGEADFGSLAREIAKVL